MLKKLFADHTVRLALRALLVAAVAFATKFVDAGGHIDYSAAGLRAAVIAGALAFCEIFTPLNGLVGLWKVKTEQQPPAA